MCELFLQLSDAVVEMDEVQSIEIAKLIVEQELDIAQAIEEGLVRGMNRAGELFEKEEYFITEILMCADAMEAAMQILKPKLPKKEMVSKGKVVIGSIYGDTHDIGKNIVALMLQAAGFEVLDLGRDVDARRFVDSAVEFDADIIAISTLMTTTMDNMGEVIKLLIEEGKRDLFKIIIGGKPVSLSFAKKIGADGYSANATAAVRLVKELTGLYNKKSNLKN